MLVGSAGSNWTSEPVFRIEPPRSGNMLKMCYFDPPTLEKHSQTFLKISIFDPLDTHSHHFPFFQNLSPRPPTYPKTTPTLPPSFPIFIPVPARNRTGHLPPPPPSTRHFLCEEDIFSVWRRHILCVKKTYSLCEEDIFSMWRRHIFFLKKTYSLWRRQIIFRPKDTAVRGQTH